MAILGGRNYLQVSDILSGLIYSAERHTLNQGGLIIMSVIVRSRLIIALIAGMALPLWLNAATDNSIYKTIHLGATATVAGKTLQEGDYDLVVNGNQAKFQNKGKVVAEVPCTWKTLQAKADHDIVLMDGGTVTEIDFQGKT